MSMLLFDHNTGFPWMPQNWLLSYPGELQGPRRKGTLNYTVMYLPMEHHAAVSKKKKKVNAIALYLWDILI